MDVAGGPATAQHFVKARSSALRQGAQLSRRAGVRTFRRLLIVPLRFLDSGGRWLWYKDTDSEIDLKAAYP